MRSIGNNNYIKKMIREKLISESPKKSDEIYGEVEDLPSSDDENNEMLIANDAENPVKQSSDEVTNTDFGKYVQKNLAYRENKFFSKEQNQNHINFHDAETPDFKDLQQYRRKNSEEFIDNSPIGKAIYLEKRSLSPLASYNVKPNIYTATSEEIQGLRSVVLDFIKNMEHNDKEKILNSFKGELKTHLDKIFDENGNWSINADSDFNICLYSIFSEYSNHEEVVSVINDSKKFIEYFDLIVDILVNANQVFTPFQLANIYCKHNSIPFIHINTEADTLQDQASAVSAQHPTKNGIVFFDTNAHFQYYKLEKNGSVIIQPIAPDGNCFYSALNYYMLYN